MPYSLKSLIENWSGNKLFRVKFEWDCSDILKSRSHMCILFHIDLEKKNVGIYPIEYTVRVFKWEIFSDCNMEWS